MIENQNRQQNVIFVNKTNISCDGINQLNSNPSNGHPKIYLSIASNKIAYNDENSYNKNILLDRIKCPYCGVLFIYDETINNN